MDRHADRVWKPVHQAGVERLLFLQVAVPLIAGGSLSGAQPKRLRRLHGRNVPGVRIVIQQSAGKQPVDEGRVRLGSKRLTVGIGGVWIGREIVIERDVLLKDDDHVANLLVRSIEAEAVPVAIAILLTMIVPIDAIVPRPDRGGIDGHDHGKGTGEQAARRATES